MYKVHIVIPVIQQNKNIPVVWYNLSNNVNELNGLPYQECYLKMVWTRVSLWVLPAVHFGTYVISYIIPCF